MESVAAARCGAGFSAAKPSRDVLVTLAELRGAGASVMVQSVNDAPLTTFHEAIEATHGAKAALVARERVDERFEGQPVWSGEVLVFELEGHPEASRCYCWEVDGEVTAVLGVPPVKSARDAVRAAILAEEA